jgi:hypothetical protein
MKLPKNELTCGFQITHGEPQTFSHKGNFIPTIDYKAIYKNYYMAPNSLSNTK